MPDRTTYHSKTTNINVDECVHCGDQIYTEKTKHIPDIPKGIPVIIGTGNGITTHEKSRPYIDYHVPEILIKWFSSEGKSVYTEIQYMCPACAEAIYDYSR